VDTIAVAFAHTDGPPARLVCADVSGETVFPLVRDSSIIGRHRNCDVLLADAKVSAYHARVDRVGDGWSIVDLRSRNGTLVNGQRVQRVSLKDGDEISVGLSRLVLRVDPGRGVQ
jgi:pSer/pThr/pTyr-binding forkhead associated (FHA) protein